MTDRTYEYSPINESPVVEMQAGADIEAIGARAVKLTKDGIVLPSADGEAVTGIVLLNEADVKKGDRLTVQLKDGTLWKSGAAVEAGDFLMADTNGKCQKATAGQYILAIALDNAEEADELIKVQIIHAGFANA